MTAQKSTLFNIFYFTGSYVGSETSQSVGDGGGDGEGNGDGDSGGGLSNIRSRENGDWW